jgi:hypothetical protein
VLGGVRAAPPFLRLDALSAATAVLADPR